MSHMKRANMPFQLSQDQLKYFTGPGQHLLNAWRKNETPAWGHIQGMLKQLQKYESFKLQDIEAGYPQPKVLAGIRDAISKLEGYSNLKYPNGKPKPKRKKTPRQFFLEEMNSPIVVAAVKRATPYFKGEPNKAAQFAYDVLEDANFREDMNVPMEDYDESPPVSTIASMLDFSNYVLPFAAALISAAGGQRSAATLIRDWAVDYYQEIYTLNS